MTVIASTASRAQAASLGVLAGAAAAVLGVLAGAAQRGGAEESVGWAAVAVFTVGGVWLAVIDARTRRLPNAITLPLSGLLALVLTCAAVTTAQWGQLLQAVLCGAGLAAALMLVAMTGTLAFGDVKLALSIGLLTGWFAWTLPLTAVAVAYLLAVPHAIALLVRKKRASAEDGPTYMPMGPYLIAGALLAALTTLLT